MSAIEELNKFIDEWNDISIEMKKGFLELKEHLESKPDVTLDFKGRAGVSYSLRAVHKNQKERNLFVMADVIDDDPDNRWLSVCFYGDMITDPDEMGDLIPGGLAGSDGYCFDLDEYNEDDVNYLKKRLDEAASKASESLE